MSLNDDLKALLPISKTSTDGVDEVCTESPVETQGPTSAQIEAIGKVLEECDIVVGQSVYRDREMARVFLLNRRPRIENMGACPSCGNGYVVEGLQGYSCSEGGCDFILWKSALLRWFEKKGEDICIEGLNGYVEASLRGSPLACDSFKGHAKTVVVVPGDKGWHLVAKKGDTRVADSEGNVLNEEGKRTGAVLSDDEKADLTERDAGYYDGDKRVTDKDGFLLKKNGKRAKDGRVSRTVKAAVGATASLRPEPSAGNSLNDRPAETKDEATSNEGSDEKDRPTKGSNNELHVDTPSEKYNHNLTQYGAMVNASAAKEGE
ncbi:hypothetical protein ACXWTF_13215 [Thiomicrolovo sp. ZZH C-3]